jgi:hypothetical protein
MNRMNKQWHAENKMPPKASLEQRIQWHREHQLHCACREVPRSVAAARPDLFAPAKSRRTSTSA